MTEDVIARQPSECSEPEIEDFVKLAADGGEVSAANVDYGTRNASYLFWLTEDKQLRSVMALKNPRASYRAGVFKKAGASARAEDFPLEIGYAHTELGATGRGYARKLIGKAMELAGGSGIYATSRCDNKTMHNILRENGFVQTGGEYESTQRNKKLVLFVRRPT